MTDDDNLLSRWSRRKRDVAKETLAEPVPEPPEADVAPLVEEGDEDEAALLARLNLPVPETLKAGDDFSPFLQSAVPEFLRRRALRVLWRSNPVLACVDGLNDYDDDFNSPELTQKVLATSYKVGKGIVRDLLQDDEAAEDMQDEAAEPEAVSIAAEEVTPDVGDNGAAAPPSPKRSVAETEAEPLEQAPRPRRMTFET